MLFLTKYESNLILHGFCSPSHYNWWRGKVTLYEDLPKFCGDNIFFWHLWQDKPLWVELKINGGVMFITILLHFHYFISLKVANTQKIELFLLTIYLRNVNASVVTSQYPQICNFSFRKECLETLCKCIYLWF